MATLKHLIRKCRRGILFFTNLSAYVAEKAQRDRWEEIIFELESFYTLHNGEFVGCSVTAGNPDYHDRKYEINVIHRSDGFQKKDSKGEKVVIKDLVDLKILAKLDALYFLRDKMIPEAQKRSVRTQPDLESVEERVKGLEAYLKKKYISNQA